MIELEPATFDDFSGDARSGAIVPVVRTIAADLQTPVGAFLRLRRGASHAFLLESVQGGTSVARYTFLGANPAKIVRGVGARTFVESEGATTMHDIDVTEYLRRHFARYKTIERENLPPLAGGCIGFLAYEAARLFEPSLAARESKREEDKHDDAIEADDAVLMFFRTVLAFDHVRQQIEITSLVFTDDLPEGGDGDAELHKRYDDAVSETARLAALLDTPLVADDKGDNPAGRKSLVEFSSNRSRDDFERAVTFVQERIRAGDCYQAVLSQRLSAEISAPPFEIYRALRRTNPAPYMYFLQLGDTAIVGASPEMLVRVRDRELTYRPIAGTRPRGRDEREDARLAEELRADEKETSEHAMLVDLGRNDLGRVAEYGSVRVARLMTIERYAHVQHLVSELHATLRPDADAFDALAACFPAGTLTGAPKLSAMNIIRDLEPTPRGVYGGAILYADYAGDLDSCIAIRTAVIRDGRAHIQAGAGIVYDSVPASEYEETMNKARALVRAIEIAESRLREGENTG